MTTRLLSSLPLLVALAAAPALRANADPAGSPPSPGSPSSPGTGTAAAGPSYLEGLAAEGLAPEPSPETASREPAPAGQQDLSALLLQAHDLFHQAANTEDADQARALYQQALDRFLRVAREGHVRNGRLFYDIGNAYYYLGDIGRSILYYRRAELLSPADRNLRHNLRFVRSQRADSLPAPGAPEAARVILFWHYLLSPPAKLWLFAVFFAAACLAGALLLVRPARWKIAAVSAAGGLAILLLASLAVDGIRLATMRDGVMTAKETVVRKGDGTAYQPSFIDPIHEGAEFSIREERAGWYWIELTDGRTGWIPASAAEMVRPD